jgi:uroporphyrinogen decarboxylase
MAAEATLQPITRFGMDAAIIFSDILVIPHALGIDVRFVEGEGPQLTPVQNEKMLSVLSISKLDSFLTPVYDALAITKAKLPRETALIGFAGSPWTLACYMVEGKGSKDFDKVKQTAKSDKKFFSGLIEILSEAVAKHVENQIQAGAEVIQLFDSWAGVLNDNEFEEWVIKPTKKIVVRIKKKYPEIPVICFPRQAGTKFLRFLEQIKVDGLSIDHSVPLEWAKEKLGNHVVLQGCLNQLLLADNKTAMLEEAKEIIQIWGDKPFVFNLAHGILPHTPVENMQALCDFLRNQKI